MSEYAPELSPYSTQVQAANNHTERLVGTVASLALGLGGVRAVAGGAAADFQRMSSGMAAAATVTHQSMGQIGGGIRQLQRDFPLATQAAVATVESIQALGLTAKNQTTQVMALSRTMTQLAAATGSFGPALAQSFGQLTRQMASLDPRRVQSFADSLTTLHARSGASAQSISQFAQSIAPMAQAAGMGETSVLGIATSFAKVGQDGYVAANTVSKMMSDMSRAVRDGSNDMAGYANVVGMTADQFSKMFRQNPAEAITRVTEAIAKMPTGQGQRSLEMLGIEGVRGQRALLSVAQSGGLRADIATAANAYGSGSTSTAAGAATRGVTDSLTRLESAASQVAEAFERPLLGAVTHVVNATSAFATGVGGIVGSRPAQAALGVAANIAVPLAVAGVGRRLFSGAALGSFLLRSGPASGFAAGLGSGRFGPTAFDEHNPYIPRTEASARMLAAEQAVRMGANPNEVFGRTTAAATANRAMFNLGSGMGAMFPATGAGTGMLRMLGGAGVLGSSMLLRSQSEMLRLARLSPMERDAYLMRPHEAGTVGHYLQQRQSLQQDLAGGFINRGQYMTALRAELGKLVVSSGEAGNALRILGGSLRELGSQAVRTAGVGARAVGGGLARGLGSLVGGPTGAAMLVGTIGFEAYQAHQADVKKREERFSNLDIFGAVNSYRDAMGQAGESAANLSTQLDAAAQSISASVTTIGQATTVSGGDFAAAQRNRNITQYYSGNQAQVAAQIAGVDTRGLKPADLQGAKLDLLRLQQSGQLPAHFDIDAALGQAAQMGKGLGGTQIDNMVAGMAHASGLGHVGFGFQKLNRIANYAGDLDHRGQWYWLGRSGAPQLGKAAGSEVDLLAGSLGQRQMDLSTRYGPRYAASQTLQAADRAMRDALKTHNADLVVGMEQELSNRLTGKTITGVSAQQIQNAGGFAQLLAQHGRRINNIDVSSLIGGTQSRSGTPRMIEDSVAQTLFNTGHQDIGRFFSNFSTGDQTNRGRRALAGAANAPEDLQKQADAVTAIVDSSQKAGMGLADLAAAAAHTTSTMADGDARRAVMVGVIAEATRRLQNAMNGMTIGQRFGAQANMAVQLSETRGNSPEAIAARAQGAQAAATTIQGEREYMQARIMAQFQFQVQSQRSREDYHLAVQRSEEDFQIGMARSQDDFYRQRYRSTRDFNIQITREQQDAAKTMYDPYTRIQAKPVYDAGNLMLNMREQLQAMRQQVRNIARLRGLGMSEASLRILGAYDPANAQQVQQLVQDLSADHSLVRQFNSQATARQGAASQLLSEDPNFKRQKADFRRQLRDSAHDYQIARDRQIADFHRSMARMATDFNTQMRRMLEDLNNSDRELTNDMGKLQADMIKILNHQSIHWTTELKNNLKDTISTIQSWTPQLLQAQNNALKAAVPHVPSGLRDPSGQTGYITGVPGGPGRVSGLHRAGANAGVNQGFLLSSASRPGTGMDRMGNPDLHWGKNIANAPQDRNLSGNAALAKGMAGAWNWGNGTEWAALYQIWNQESGFNPHAGNVNAAYGIPQADPGWKMGDKAHWGKHAHSDWRNNPRSQIDWGLAYIRSAYGDPLGAWAHKSRTGWYGEGSIFTTPRHIGVGEKGPEAVIPLDERGVNVLARAFGSYLAPHEAASLGGGGRAYAVHITNTGPTIYDHSVQFPGAHIDLTADDPTEFARKMEAKVKRDRLTAARGVAWQTS